MGKRVKRKKLNYFNENIIAVLIFTGLLLIVLIQFLMTDDNIRSALNMTEKNEGISLNTYLSEKGYVTIEVIDKEQAKNSYILINGEPIANFTKKFVEIEVKQNEILEIDSTKESEPIYFKITNTSDNVIEPQKTTIIYTDKNIKKICMVVLK
ncbi:MAG: hypothetical protein ACPL3A_01110 [Thermoanaerobacteraceae bacterium]